MVRGTAAPAFLTAALALSCADSPADPEASDDGNRGPMAQIMSPADGAAFIAGDAVVFEGTADDPEDGALDGPFLDWTSSLDGRFGIGRALAASDLSTGEHRITLTATDSDGASAEDEISVVVSENRSPSVTIAAPATGSIHAEGDVIRFEGSAADPEDGTLTGESLVWRSSQVGDIGTGESVELSQPSVGYHRIVLFAVDSRGACGWDDIFLEVEAANAVTLAGHSVNFAGRMPSGTFTQRTLTSVPDGTGVYVQVIRITPENRGSSASKVTACSMRRSLTSGTKPTSTSSASAEDFPGG